MDELSSAAEALEVLRQAAALIDASHLGCQTPCRDYDVAALADHVIGSVTRISAAAGVTVAPPAADAMMSRVVDAGWDALTGWRSRGVDGEVDFGGRTLGVRDLLGVIALEFVVHGWDFATAVGGTLVVPDELATDLLRLTHRTITDESRRLVGFDMAVAVAEDASALDQLLAFTGRNPSARTLLR